MDPYLYQYGGGGIVFGVGLYFAVRQGFVGLSGRGLRNLVILLGVLIFFMVIQGYLQYAPMAEARPVPFAGDAPDEGPSRTSIGTADDYAVIAVYMIAILVIGTAFARRNTGTRDFFFGGGVDRPGGPSPRRLGQQRRRSVRRPDGLGRPRVLNELQINDIL